MKYLEEIMEEMGIMNEFDATTELQELGINSLQMTGHERDIILHEVAAKAFKASGISKLPNLAALQKEYEPFKRRKKPFTPYGKLKKKVREYDVIKQNIDSILRQEKEPGRARKQSADRNSKNPSAVL